MTTPDIEKLRGLSQSWRNRLNKCVGYPVCDGDLPGEEHDPKCPEYGRAAYTPIRVRDCIAELEAAGLPELLRDYERLLANENGDKS